MKEAKYITPRLGLRSAPILGLMCISTFILTKEFISVATAPMQDPTAYVFMDMWLFGIFFGLASGGCWLATIVHRRYLRWAIRVAIVVLLAYAKHSVKLASWLDQPSNWFQHLSDLGGLAFAQCMLFFWLRVPNWEVAWRQPVGNPPAELSQRKEPADSKRMGRQFGIGDVVIATTVVAVLLSIGFQSTPYDGPGFWVGLVSVWAIGPMIAACIAIGILNRRIYIALGTLLLALLLAVGGAVGLSYGNAAIAERAPAATEIEIFAIYVELYGRIIVGFLATMAVFAVAGRVQVSVGSEPMPSVNELDS